MNTMDTTHFMNMTTTASTATLVKELKVWESVAVVVVLFIVSLALLGNIGAVLAILKSDFRSRISGHLLLNQAAADIGFLAVGLVILVFKKWYLTDGVGTILTVLVLLWTCVIGAGAHSMAIVSFNLYLAICHSSKYKTLVTKKRLHVTMLISWVINGLFLLQFFYYDQFMYYDHRYKQVMSNYSPHVVWMGVLIVFNCPIVPFITTVVCFTYIVKHTRRIFPSSLNAHSENRFRLSKIILVNIALFSSTYVLLLVAQAVRYSPLNFVTSFIHFIYHLTKLPLLLVFYPPLRKYVSLCKVKERPTDQ